MAGAQVLGTKYLWQDSLKVTTAGFDSTFVQRWEDIQFWSYGCDILVKASAPDTVGFANRKFIRLEDGVPGSFGPATPVKRMLIKAVSDSGVVFFSGYKTIRQR